MVEQRTFLGMVDREILMKHLHEPGAPLVRSIFGENLPVMALADETCRIVATRLAVHGLERLPVVRDAHSRDLLGLIARSDLVKPSGSLHDEEHNFEQFNSWPWRRK